jgi:hypothetical protein
VQRHSIPSVGDVVVVVVVVDCAVGDVVGDG